MRRRRLSSVESAPPSPTRVDNLPVSHYYISDPQSLEIIENLTPQKKIIRPQKTNNETNNETNNKNNKNNKKKTKKKTKKKRCGMCRKKLGLIPFKCRCEKMFCAKHRYSDVHKCDYDYKTSYTQKYTEDNPKIVPNKIIHI